MRTEDEQIDDIVALAFGDEPKRSKSNGSSGSDWGEPDQTILDDRRGSLPDFPLDTLSATCSAWVERAAHGAGVTPAHVAIPLIGICSSLIGTARRVRASPTWSEPMTCWCAVVGFSGSGKTPGIDATRRALAFVERNRRKEIFELKLAHEKKREVAKQMRDAWKERLKKLRGEIVVDLKEYAGLLKDEPAMPPEAEDPGPFIAPRLHMSNATIERVAQLLEVQSQGALLLSDELSSLFLNMRRYSGGQDNEFWLEAWNGASYTVERLSRAAIALDHLLVGLVGGLQPDKLARSFKGDLDGMYTRFLFAWPPEASYRPLAKDGAEVEPEIVNAITRLVKLESGKSEEGGFAPRARPLSDEATERFEQFRKPWDAGKQALDGREREWWAKMPAHVLRLAGTLCLLDWAFVGGDEPTNIGDRYLQAAIELVQSYFWEHARACLRQVGLSDRHADARRALRWMRANDRKQVTREEIRRDALGRKLDAGETETLLQGLEKAGWVKKIIPGPKVGRPPSHWSVNPILFGAAEIPETPETHTNNCDPHAPG
jgi:hypothetical protein